MIIINRPDTTSNRIKKALKLRGMKQIDLSNKSGIDKGSISYYCSGKYEPKQDAIYKMAKVLDVSEMWLWGYDCPMDRPIAQKNNDELSEITKRLNSDTDFFSLVKTLNSLDKEKLISVTQMLCAFTK